MNITVLIRAKKRLNDKIGFSLLPHSTIQFIFTHFNYMLFTTIPGIFINTFFYNQDHKISTVAIFTAITCVVSSITMHLASVVSFKTSSSFTIRIGVAIFNVFFVALLLLQNQASKYMVLLALINAAANGFYWQGYNELTKALTSEGNFDRTISLLGMVGSLVNLAVPLVSGYVIVLSPSKNIGYTLIFAISFIFSLYTTYLSFKLKAQKKQNTKSNILGMYRFIFTDKIAFASCVAEFIRGLRNSSFPVFLSIIFYKQIMNEGILGINTTISGLAAIITYITASKILRPNNRIKYIFISTFLAIVLYLTLFISMSPAIIFALTVLNSILAVFIDNPSISIFFTVFRDVNNGVNFSQLMSGREVFFALGRALGLILLIALSNSKTSLAFYALIVNVAMLLMLALYTYSYKKYLKEQIISN